MEWFPKWMEAYSRFPCVVEDQSAAPNHAVNKELLIAFLQSLRDRKKTKGAIRLRGQTSLCGIKKT
jgi:hypothetical protein